MCKDTRALHDGGVRLARCLGVSCRDRDLYTRSLPARHLCHVMRVSEAVLWQGRRRRMMLAACSVQRGRSHEANTRTRVQQPKAQIQQLCSVLHRLGKEKLGVD